MRWMSWRAPRKGEQAAGKPGRRSSPSYTSRRPAGDVDRDEAQGLLALGNGIRPRQSDR